MIKIRVCKIIVLKRFILWTYIKNIYHIYINYVLYIKFINYSYKIVVYI